MGENMSDGWQKTANTIMLSIITGTIMVGTSLLVSDSKMQNEKLDKLMIQTTLNAANLNSHTLDADQWKRRIEKLEKGEAEATMDRITKTEVYDALDEIKIWVDKYYERK